jgi:hypothetical protein
MTKARILTHVPTLLTSPAQLQRECTPSDSLLSASDRFKKKKKKNYRHLTQAHGKTHHKQQCGLKGGMVQPCKYWYTTPSIRVCKKCMHHIQLHLVSSCDKFGA